jgi:uncharacterized protein YbcI
MGAGLQNACSGMVGLADRGESQHGLGGELNASIARAVVRIYREICGRGPTKARATYHGTVVVVVLERVMTQAERSLVASGRCDQALALRRELHGAMRDELARAVAELTRCRVRAVMGNSEFDPDLAVEVFVLDRPVSPTPAAAQAGERGRAADVGHSRHVDRLPRMGEG